jgi:pSer/pThr/pTyr-binding forkhead associated (FHA) protein
MVAHVKVTIKDQVLPAREFVFGSRTICTVGRAQDCYLQMPGDLLHRAISRHHCVLDINPPTVMIRDLGSRNGTFINGKKIGQRGPGLDPEQANASDLPECPVHPGDTIQLGETFLEVSVCSSDTLIGSEDDEENQTPHTAQSSMPLKDWAL